MTAVNATATFFDFSVTGPFLIFDCTVHPAALAWIGGARQRHGLASEALRTAAVINVHVAAATLWSIAFLGRRRSLGPFRPPLHHGTQTGPIRRNEERRWRPVPKGALELHDVRVGT
jgi:hypothetical protein